MGLPLLFGIITYLLIIFCLTCWLTKYHACNCRSASQHGDLVGREDYFGDESISPEKNLPANNPEIIVPSGNQSLIKEDHGGVRQE